MDIYWYGQACFKIKGKGTTVIIDPFDPEFTGLKLPKDLPGRQAGLEADIVLSTHNHQDHNNTRAVSGKPLVITGPGEYEKSGVIITGIQAYHDQSKGSERGMVSIYHILMDGIKLLHLGDVGHLLEEEQLSQIDNVDILMIPVGGLYTINAEVAAKMVAQVEPGIVIPMHYKVEGLKFDLDGAENFLKEMGAESMTPVSKLTITKDKLPEETTVVLLSKS